MSELLKFWPKLTAEETEHVLEKAMQREETKTPAPLTIKTRHEDSENGRIFYHNEKSKPQSVIFYIHGGAYFYDIVPPHWQLIEKVAKKTGAEFIVPAYRLVPYATYKEAYDLIVPLYKKVCREFRGAKVMLMGDSAGGGFCLALAEYFREEGLKMREPGAVADAKRELEDEMGFYFFQQFEFERQWEKLHAYAKKQGISIIGDIPFYVAMDSAASWAHKEIFHMDKEGDPIDVAGCAPDAFSKTGQLWGNPLYDWKALKKNGYQWWINRIARNMEFYDILRIDHFNGFAEYYAVPYGDKTAENGEIRKGPGMDFFKNLKKKLGDVPIIAEDLGTLTPVTEKLLEDAGYPGMKVLQYAFDWTEYSYYLPYNHIKNCVVYTGTHDNTTTRAWIEEISDHDRDLARRYIHSENTDYGTFVWDMIREAYRSVADLCIIPMQDYLVKGSEARINHPGTLGENWKWRLQPNFLSKDLSASIYKLAKLYGRIPKEEKKDDETVK